MLTQFTQRDADWINTTAVVLRHQRADEPPTIELREACVSAFLVEALGAPRVVVNLVTRGVDLRSILATPAGLSFELCVNGGTIATGVVELADHRVALLEVEKL